MIDIKKLCDDCTKLSTKHHASLWKRHLFADMLHFAYNDVEHYQSDFFTDAIEVYSLIEPKEDTQLIMYYAWHDTGTRVWIYSPSDPELNHVAIMRYILSMRKVTAIKIRIMQSHYKNHISLAYQPIVHDGILLDMKAHK